MTRILGDAWEVLDQVVGRGASSEVRLGRRVGDGASVAVKLLHRDRCREPAATHRFAREFAVLRGRPHPNVVSVFDLIDDGESRAIVMEHVTGGDLRRRLDAAPGRRVDPALALRWAADIAVGLDHLHRAGAVHRDVKPENILLAPSPEGNEAAKLGDFGLARLTGSTSVTHDGAFRGTPDYASPEALALGPRRPVTPAADIYSLGCVLFEMLTGTPPFRVEGDVLATALRQTMEPATRPAGIDDDLWTVLDAMLAKRPKDRPAAVAVAAQLRNLDPARVAPAITGDAGPGAGTITIDPPTAPTGASSPADPAVGACIAPPAEVAAAVGPDGAPATVPAPTNAAVFDERAPTGDGDDPSDRVIAIARQAVRPVAVRPVGVQGQEPAAQAVVIRRPAAAGRRRLRDDRPGAGLQRRPRRARRWVAGAATVALIAVAVAGMDDGPRRPASSPVAPTGDLIVSVAPVAAVAGVEVGEQRWVVNAARDRLTGELRARNATEAAIALEDGVIDVIPAELRADAARMASTETVRATVRPDGSVVVGLSLQLEPGTAVRVRYVVPIAPVAPVNRSGLLSARRRAASALPPAASAADASAAAGEGTAAGPAVDATSLPAAAVGAAVATARGAVSGRAAPTGTDAAVVVGGDNGGPASDGTSARSPASDRPPRSDSPATTAPPATTTTAPPSTLQLYVMGFDGYVDTANEVSQAFTGRAGTVTEVRLYLKATGSVALTVWVGVRDGTGTCSRIVNAGTAGGTVDVPLNCRITSQSNAISVNLKNHAVLVGMRGDKVSGRVLSQR